MRPRRVDRSTIRTIVDRANLFLAAEERSRIDARAIAVGVDRGRIVGLPDGCAGFPGGTRAEPLVRARRADTLGVAREVDRRVAAVADLFEHPPCLRPTAIGVWGPSCGAARDAAILLARAARLSGVVPICASLLNGLYAELVADRSLLIICTADPAIGWRALVHATLQTASSHLVLFAGPDRASTVHTLVMPRRTAASLLSSVRPVALSTALARRARIAARRADGLPDRFEALLWGHAAPRGGRTRSWSKGRETWEEQPMPSRAAERSVPYVVPVPPAGEPNVADDAGRSGGAPPRAAGPVGRVVDHALPRLRRDLAIAQERIAGGRHAAGSRAARQAIAALARRGDWTHAAEGAISLAEAFRRRGEAASADVLLRGARDWVSRSHDPRVLNRLALITGKLLTDAGHLSEAHRTLAAALAASRGAGHAEWRESARALARCQFWQGEFEDAWRTLTLEDAEPLADGERVLWSALRARIALGRARIGDAIAEAVRARDGARDVGAAHVQAAAGYAWSLALLAAGDLVQADAAAGDALAAARVTRRQALTACLRLLRAEIARRQGSLGPASRLVGRFSRIPPARLPPVLRIRLELLRDIVGGLSPSEAASRRGAATGFKAIALLVPHGEPLSGSGAADAVGELLQCCQEADDDQAVLTSACARVRARLRATAAAFLALDQGQFVPVASDGGRVDPAMAARVHSARQLVLPHYGTDRLEAGVPVRYAGQISGVLVVRWAAGSRWRDDEVSLLLSTAAAASGPALSGVAERRRAAAAMPKSDLLGVSEAMARVRTAIDGAAAAPFPVLVEGESGSGKELVARLLHRQSPRRDRPFCALNCAALPDDLIESELFGHARGAFTGALVERRGVFEEAHGGTLFLDEVGELSPRAQAKLLRAVQEGEIRRLGENLHRRVDVRLVAATNRDLRAEVASGRFRMDLLFRLDVIRIALPPLRQRIEDIELLALHYWRESSARVGSRAVLAASTVAALARYSWPGNIRELQNVLASLAVRAPRRGIVPPTALPPHLAAAAPRAVRLEDARHEFESRFVRAALARAGGNRTRAAEELGISRQGLAKVMGRLHIEDGGDGGDEAEGPQSTTSPDDGGP
ncbi:MAG: sigma 54-interacting transcriptional regulator [Vicinamibacterales bacterium]